jgi:leucyl/phenylalanyl-tRNA--protein transferase
VSIFYLSPELIQFPDPNKSEPDGLLAVGGDLSPQRLYAAYRLGIFPWYGEDMPLLWWSPDPRCVLDLAELRAPRRLLRSLKGARLRATLDTRFEEVIRACAASKRQRGGGGTWILPEMIEAYCAFHEAGFAHSIEIWDEEGVELLGGLYGVSLGRAFFGESMFYRRSPASKVALLSLAGLLKDWGFHFLDCQQTTEHVLTYGAREIPRREFLRRLGEALAGPTLRGRWIWPEGRTPGLL